MALGSLCLAKISRSSSSDKKQNRGKSVLLVSRKEARAFMIWSTDSLCVFRYSGRFLDFDRNLEALLSLSA